MISFHPFNAIAVDLYSPGSTTASAFRYVLTVVAVKAGLIFSSTLFVEKLFDKIPAQFIWFIVLTGLMQWVYRYHKFGNHIHFVGDNKASSQMMGINVDNVKIIAFVQLGFFSAFAGIFTMYEMLYFWPTQGSGLMLTTLAAVFVGGTSVFGGKGTIFGTFIGVLIIGSLESGIVALGLSGFYVQFINGIMITSAVTIYAIIQRKKT